VSRGSADVSDGSQRPSSGTVYSNSRVG
jgi:hypothetical protein